MKTVAFIEDDPVVIDIYRPRLERAGFGVTTAQDGLAALKLLRDQVPDLVILDLLMPKFSGMDVLKFIRSQDRLRTVPVLVLSNFYLNETVQEAVHRDADCALLKSQCTPSLLLDVVNHLVNGTPLPRGVESLLRGRKPVSTESTSPGPLPPPPPVVAVKPPTPLPPPEPEVIGRSSTPALPSTARPVAIFPPAESGPNFLAGAPVICRIASAAYENFTRAVEPAQRETLLMELHRKIELLTSMAAMAVHPAIANLAGTLAPLIFEMHARPQLIHPSALRTIQRALDQLEELVEHPAPEPESPLRTVHVLVVDDDPLANRLATSVLARCRLETLSTTTAYEALRSLHQTRFDLVILDIELPGMSGIELCTQLRALPGYDKVPVIFLTSHDDFENRVRGILSGGDDLIAKPVHGQELAVKVVSLLVRRHINWAFPGAPGT